MEPLIPNGCGSDGARGQKKRSRCACRLPAAAGHGRWPCRAAPGELVELCQRHCRSQNRRHRDAALSALVCASPRLLAFISAEPNCGSELRSLRWCMRGGQRDRRVLRRPPDRRIVTPTAHLPRRMRSKRPSFSISKPRLLPIPRMANATLGRTTIGSTFGTDFPGAMQNSTNPKISSV